jgi:hypothetical protein
VCPWKGYWRSKPSLSFSGGHEGKSFLCSLHYVLPFHRPKSNGTYTPWIETTRLSENKPFLFLHWLCQIFCSSLESRLTERGIFGSNRLVTKRWIQYKIHLPWIASWFCLVLLWRWDGEIAENACFEGKKLYTFLSFSAHFCSGRYYECYHGSK